MLRTRVITAVVILLVLVGMLFFAPASAWGLFMLAVALAACWEWSRLCGLGRTGQSVYLLLSGALGGCAWMMQLRLPESLFRDFALVGLAFAAAFWIVVALPWLRYKWRPAPVLAALAGWLVIWPTWFAFISCGTSAPGCSLRPRPSCGSRTSPRISPGGASASASSRPRSARASPGRACTAALPA
jgi:phosphatidate cytidylyltransferase